ncbi:MAG: (d)CMP kinase [Desulfosalsimonadaceae bacterium]
MKDMLVTIDGPAGAGKTSVSRRLAHRLGYVYVDTGALYRGVAWEASQNGISCEDESGLAKLCENLDLSFFPAPDGSRLYCRGMDISENIRTPEISMLASSVSAIPVVRRALFDIQRRLGAEKKAVFEGRDMGTVVFPEAEAKFFLTANIEERARRRYRELSGVSGQSLADVTEEMKKRDANDSSRAQAPLKPAADALVIDSTLLSAEDVAEAMMEHLRRL